MARSGSCTSRITGPRKGWFELNDTFGLFFSSISIALIYFGLRGHPVLLGAGLGMVGYGAIYFLMHDVLVHRRVRHVFVPRSGYLRAGLSGAPFASCTRNQGGSRIFRLRLCARA